MNGTSSQLDIIETTNLSKIMFQKITKIHHYQFSVEKKSWFECYEIAKNIILGKINNPTKATYFNSFDKKEDVEWFENYVVPKGKFIRKFGNIYFYWSPN